jgi:hypothetical protein
MSRQALPRKQSYAEAIPVPKGWKCPLPKCQEKRKAYPLWKLIPRESGNGFKGPFLYVAHGSKSKTGTQSRVVHYIPQALAKKLNLPSPKHLQPDPPSLLGEKRGK